MFRGNILGIPDMPTFFVAPESCAFVDVHVMWSVMEMPNAATGLLVHTSLMRSFSIICMSNVHGCAVR
jgi:hypothetical protein